MPNFIASYNPSYVNLLEFLGTSGIQDFIKEYSSLNEPEKNILDALFDHMKEDDLEEFLSSKVYQENFLKYDETFVVEKIMKANYKINLQKIYKSEALACLKLNPSDSLSFKEMELQSRFDLSVKGYKECKKKMLVLENKDLKSIVQSQKKEKTHLSMYS